MSAISRVSWRCLELTAWLRIGVRQLVDRLVAPAKLRWNQPRTVGHSGMVGRLVRAAVRVCGLHVDCTWLARVPWSNIFASAGRAEGNGTFAQGIAAARLPHGCSCSASS